MDSLKDIISFLASRKKYWLLPITVILLMLGLILLFSGGSALAPFIYTLF